jgi:hypothetical protein
MVMMVVVVAVTMESLFTVAAVYCMAKRSGSAMDSIAVIVVEDGRITCLHMVSQDTFHELGSLLSCYTAFWSDRKDSQETKGRSKQVD